MDETTFGWITACHVAEILDDVSPSEIEVWVEIGKFGAWEPIIAYYDLRTGAAHVAKWHFGQALKELDWSYDLAKGE